MTKSGKTFIFCLDEHRNLTDDVRKRFSDISKYRIFSSSSASDFLKTFLGEKEHRNCKIAILAVFELAEQGQAVDNLTKEIKKIDPSTGLILIYPPARSEEIKKREIFNIDAWIPKNENTILRLHNAVKKLVSEYNIRIFSRRRNISVSLLLAFILLSAIFLLVAILKLPQYF